jgi:hypothetical protein
MFNQKYAEFDANENRMEESESINKLFLVAIVGHGRQNRFIAVKAQPVVDAQDFTAPLAMVFLQYELRGIICPVGLNEG